MFHIKCFPPNRYQLWNPGVSDYFIHWGWVLCNHRSLAIPVVNSHQTEFLDQRITEADRYCRSPEHQGHMRISTGNTNWYASANYWSTSRNDILFLQQFACGFVVRFNTHVIQSLLSLTFVFLGATSLWGCTIIRLCVQPTHWKIQSVFGE